MRFVFFKKSSLFAVAGLEILSGQTECLRNVAEAVEDLRPGVQNQRVLLYSTKRGQIDQTRMRLIRYFGLRLRLGGIRAILGGFGGRGIL